MNKSAKGNTGQSTVSQDDIKKATPWMMASAQAHQRVATMCFDASQEQWPSIEAVFFNVVSFEQILLSVEQSMRLVLLLCFSSLHSSHNPHSLFRTIRDKSGGSGGLRDAIVDNTNEFLKSVPLPPISEKDLKRTFKRHGPSYSNFRYFGLNHLAKRSHQWEVKPRDIQIMHCVALGLIKTNMQEMEKRGIGVLSSIRKVPEPEMTDDLKELMAWMRAP